ncbi:hypothetical protein ABZV93_03045 [Actinopolymorpha sp. NPDC004070]|uniref:hypothetical protein n=1 Tax=Actinopolymorpha sp. NPDC004070 TaxID=3154548 RepID=UPI0033B3CDD4
MVRNSIRLAGRVLAVLTLAGVLLVLGLFLDHGRASTAAELRDVHLGLPFDWIRQDQSWMDPPEGQASGLRFGLPQENPTRISAGMLALDLALDLALVSSAVAVVGVGVHRFLFRL